ncbi:TIGR01459 family HAD-type hydrolase [Salinarimonas soli]|uniref:TIGR01459 family HAD-type hydrolase n=1 Tax=Salinarimonas soli TaxID=1638099 RepID=A0A5B2V958_9HYPH|nr:TIGR01459 family HAD-type hydrolase [Salinarimonas soli]KAA2235105.1 TIGR01459 family HAD-type hydrolase [Salinarimonas soli]
MNAQTQPPIELVTGLSVLQPRYDLILCDVWGVLHNGIAAHPGAADALTRFRERGGTVILVSNAPRPGGAVIEQLDGFGVPRSAFDDILTSGDLTRRAVAERAGQPVHHLGPARDLPIFDGLDVRLAPVEEADYVVCSGLLDDDEDTPEDYRPLFERMRARDLLMICANPDLVVERGDVLIPCAGALALLYEEMGGETFYAGKPHRPVYEAAVERAGAIRGRPVGPDRILAVGDAIRTDIAGAAGFGMAALLVGRGIHTEDLGLSHGPLDPARALPWLNRQPHRPTAMIELLVW